MSSRKSSLISYCASIFFVAFASLSVAASLPNRHLAEEQSELLDADVTPSNRTRLKTGIRTVFDIAYGSDTRQRFDVYTPLNTKNAPVIFMVHGGGWAFGDKAGSAVVDNKVKRWVSRGFILISTNYRMLPDTLPIEQANDVARALAMAQDQVASWDGNREKFILMGHSAGAHLVSLLNASPALASGLGITPWLGTVSLDSAALDVVGQMESRHVRLYDRAFGRDPAYWQQASPYHVLSKSSMPLWRFALRGAVPRAHMLNAMSQRQIHSAYVLLY